MEGAIELFEDHKSKNGISEEARSTIKERKKNMSKNW